MSGDEDRIFDLVIFKCPDSNCDECLTYDSVAERGVCTSCVTYYEVTNGLDCVEICGDSNIIGSETCEDGNSVDSDGCTDCSKDIGYDCPTIN